MSATPVFSQHPRHCKRRAKFVYVDPKDVIEEGMIKKEIIINENLGLVDDENIARHHLAAYNKRLKLKQAYINAGSNMSSLLNSIPNAEAGVAKKEVIEAFLADKGITETNEN